jgi:hypothetical protein
MYLVRITAAKNISRHHFDTEDRARAMCMALRYANDVERIELYQSDDNAPGLVLHPEPIAVWDSRMSYGMARECTPVIINPEGY